jgi:hypothetical protein
MKDKLDILEIIKRVIKGGVEVRLSWRENCMWVDLNTGAKSGCHLECKENGDIIAHRRYDRIDKVTDFNHLCELVADCRHGRTYFSSDWANILKEEDVFLEEGYI